MASAKRTWNTIAVIGVGLIGGSIGMAVRQRKLAQKVIGIGRRPVSLANAQRCGAVDTTSSNIASGVAEADFVIVCTPVEIIVQQVLQAAEACPEGAIITDAGSTKASIVAELDRSWKGSGHFVGSHPLTGSEKTGCENGHADLFQDRTVVITPSRQSNPESVQQLHDFWSALGMQVLQMSPQSHDAALAVTSHLPHAVASALAAVTPAEQLPLVAGGWLDTTRVAAADEKLWRQILLDNAEHSLQAIDQFEQSLAAMKRAIADRDGQKLQCLLAQGRMRREAAE